jgi:hypothetical protein
MPRIARRRRRETASEKELAAWCSAFETGHNFLGELQALGIDCHTPRCNPNDRKTCEEAWHRLGRAYMAQREEPPFNPEVPWALTEFGEPRGR